MSNYIVSIEEFESNFESYIDEALIIFHDYTRQALLTEIKIWYNGYSWDGKKTLYNPFGILLFLNSYDFQSYWFASGTPSFLIKKTKRYNSETVLEVSFRASLTSRILGCKYLLNFINTKTISTLKKI